MWKVLPGLTAASPLWGHKVLTSLCKSISFSFFPNIFLCSLIISIYMRNILSWFYTERLRCSSPPLSPCFIIAVSCLLSPLTLAWTPCWWYSWKMPAWLLLLGVPSAWSSFHYIFAWIKLSYIFQSLCSCVILPD